jgi:hypothetical protein
MESMMPPPPNVPGVAHREFRAFPGPATEDAARVLLRTMIGGGPGFGFGPMTVMRGGFEMGP